MTLNLGCILRESAKSYPDKPALIYDGGPLTYAELDALSDRFAARSAARGVRPGDRSRLQLPNIPQFVIAYFGILKAGCVAVPMNVLLKARRGRLPASATARPGADHLGRGRSTEAAKGAADGGRRASCTWSTRRACPRSTLGERRSRQLLDADPSVPPPLRADRPGRHRGDHLHLRHDGPAEGRRAHATSSCS